MHSNRMRTNRRLTVSRSILYWQGGGGCIYLDIGVEAYLEVGGQPGQGKVTYLDGNPPVYRQTPVKTLPCHISYAVGKYSQSMGKPFSLDKRDHFVDRKILTCILQWWPMANSIFNYDPSQYIDLKNNTSQFFAAHVANRANVMFSQASVILSTPRPVGG